MPHAKCCNPSSGNLCCSRDLLRVPGQTSKAHRVEPRCPRRPHQQPTLAKRRYRQFLYTPTADRDNSQRCRQIENDQRTNLPYGHHTLRRGSEYINGQANRQHHQAECPSQWSSD